MSSSNNERNTENLVRDCLRLFDYYDTDNDIRVEEQKTNIESVKRILKTASKSGKGGKGAPEFIISSPSTPDFLLIIECKAKSKDHISSECEDYLKGTDLIDGEQYSKNAQRYAVDGVLHYARKLSKEFNVIAIAVSGETGSEVIISNFLHVMGGNRPKFLKTKEGTQINKIIPWHDYIEHGTFDPSVQRMRFNELMAFSRDLHEFMRDHAKLTESEKPLLVSGTLIGLRNRAFTMSYIASLRDLYQGKYHLNFSYL